MATQLDPSKTLQVVGALLLATLAAASTFYLGRLTADEEKDNAMDDKPKSTPSACGSDYDESQSGRSLKGHTGLTRRRSGSFRQTGMLTSNPSYHSLSSSGCSHMAVLVVDCQPAYWDNGLCAAAFPELPNKVANLLSFARERLSPPQIIHIRANYSHKFVQNFLLLNPERTLPADVMACPWAAASVGEMVVTKPSFDAFYNTNLREHLRSLGTTHIVVCGMLTSACVLFTCQSAFACGLRITLIENATGDRTVETHKNIIDIYNDYLYKVSNDLDYVFEKDTGYEIPPDMN